MVCLHNIRRLTASLPLLPADDHFDRPTSPRVMFQELAQIWAIADSLLQCWTASVEQPTVPLHLRDSEHTFPGVPPVNTEDAPVLLRTAAPSDCLLFERFIISLLHLHYIIISPLSLKSSDMARCVTTRSHSFNSHQHTNHTPQPQGVTALWLVLIAPTHERIARLS